MIVVVTRGAVSGVSSKPQKLYYFLGGWVFGDKKVPVLDTVSSNPAEALKQTVNFDTVKLQVIT